MASGPPEEVTWRRQAKTKAVARYSSPALARLIETLADANDQATPPPPPFPVLTGQVSSLPSY